MSVCAAALRGTVGVVALAVIGVVGGLFWVNRQQTATPLPKPVPTPVPTPTQSSSAAPIEFGSEPPVVDVSSLPSAGTTKKPLGKGKLSVDMAGGWCTIKIDGVEIGPTPVADHELAAGVHTVSCTPDGGGKTKRETVWVNASETKKLKFQ